MLCAIDKKIQNQDGSSSRYKNSKRKTKRPTKHPHSTLITNQHAPPKSKSTRDREVGPVLCHLEQRNAGKDPKSKCNVSADSLKKSRTYLAMSEEYCLNNCVVINVLLMTDL